MDHEILDDTVEVQAVVIPVIDELEEVPSGLWAVLGVECDFYRSGAGCHLDYSRHAVGSVHRHKSICVQVYATIEPGSTPSGNSSNRTVPSGSSAPRTRN